MKDYRIELHMHTSEVSPCGQVSAREGVGLYKKFGYDGVVITDHFTCPIIESFQIKSWKKIIDRWLKGYRAALEEGDKLGLKVLLGMEFTFKGTNNDILVYGLDEKFLYDHEDLCYSSEKELRPLADKWGLVLLQAHPYRVMITKVYDAIMDGFEVYNGNPRHNSYNDKALAHATSLDKIQVSGSDFHQVQDGARGGILLPQLPADSKALAQMLREIKTPRLIRDGKE